MLTTYLKNRRISAVLLLGLSSGLPLALTGSTLQAWFTQSGVNLLAIGALSLLGMPYVWKFVWAPFLDRFVPPFLGRRRGWILFTQIALCIILLTLAQLNPVSQPGIIGILALIIAFTAASQDIAVDAYRTDVLRPDERGLGAAVFTLGFRLAMLVSGGLALIMADYWGWRHTYELMAALIALLTLATYFAPEVPNTLQPPKTLFAAVIEPFRDLLQRESIFLIVLFVLFYKIGDALSLALMSNFLLRELGFSLTEVGIAFKLFGLIATIFGAVLGGILLTRINLFHALLAFGLLQAFSNLLIVLLALVGKNYLLMVSTIFVESFCSGMGTAAFVAFLMSLCNTRYSATQYACLSALFSLGRVIAGPLAAVMVAKFGWVNFYWWAFLLSFPGLLFLIALRNRVSINNVAAPI